MSYGPNYSDQFRRTAELVDKILRGAKSSDIPVEQPRLSAQDRHAPDLHGNRKQRNPNQEKTTRSQERRDRCLRAID